MNDAFAVFWSWVFVGMAVWICAEPKLYPESVKHAEDVCATNDGWAYIEEGVGEFSSVTCKNGATFDYNWNELKGGKNE